jgi:hypothetical protein
MRNVLATAVLVAAVGVIADVRQPAAQFFQPERPTPQIQSQRPTPETSAPTGVQSADKAGKAKTVARRGGKAHKKHHVVRSPPNQRKIAEKNGYKRVSDLVNFPKFSPGLGIIYVKPETLPVGPFLCFDRSDRFIATVYMIPMKDIDDHKSLEASGVDEKVDHVSFYFNAGHPGVDVPHYHVVVWHVTKKEEARVAE